MRKALCVLSAVATVAMTMLSCSKEKNIDADVKFSVSTPSGASWSGKETIAFSAGGAAPVTVQATSGERTEVNVTLSDLPKSGTIYAVSPYAPDGNGVSAMAADALTVTIPANQTSRASSCDAGAQILVGSVPYSNTLPSSVNISMSRASAAVKLDLSNAPEEMKSVTLTFPGKVAGTFRYNLSNGSWSEEDAVNTLTVKAASEASAIWFGCAAAALTGDITAEFTGAVTGAKYVVTIPASKMNLTSGKPVEIAVEVPLSLYIVGSAVGKTAAADALAMTKNTDGSYSWTGSMSADGEFTLIFDQANLTPAFTVGTAYNNIKYSTRASATPFEVAKAGKYTVTVWPAKGHIQVRRIFDHVLSGNDGVGPMDEEFDDCEIAEGSPHEWETRFGCIWQNHAYKDFGINDEFKLSGPNSYWLDVTYAQTDMNQGRIIRSGDWFQPYAVTGKTYTVSFQMMYEGENPEETIVWRIEGSIGSGAGYDEEVKLENGVPFQVSKDFEATGAWGGCTNFFIYFHKCTSPFVFYLDAINIGYDD